MLCFPVAARKDQPRMTGSWAKLRTDNRREADVGVVGVVGVGPRSEM